jgi:hypothetical protein
MIPSVGMGFWETRNVCQASNMKVTVFRNVAPCSCRIEVPRFRRNLLYLFVLYPEDAVRTFFQNVRLQNSTVSSPKNGTFQGTLKFETSSYKWLVYIYQTTRHQVPKSVSIWVPWDWGSWFFRNVGTTHKIIRRLNSIESWSSVLFPPLPGAISAIFSRHKSTFYYLFRLITSSLVCKL